MPVPTNYDPEETSRFGPFDRFCRLYRRIRGTEEKSADFHDLLAGIDDRGMNIRLGYSYSPSIEMAPGGQPLEASPALSDRPPCLPAPQAPPFVSRQVSAHHEAVDG